MTTAAAIFALSAALALALPAHGAEREIEAPGPEGPLRAALMTPDDAPVEAAAVIIPGSGPTDRDGNAPVGMKTDLYLLLARGLVAEGIATARIDKRGMFRSKAALADPNTATIDGYADDLRAWAKVVRSETGLPCVWLMGHSEGGMVALKAVERSDGICGLILLTTPGRPIGELMREQFWREPAQRPLFRRFEWAVSEIEKGKPFDPEVLPLPLQPIFSESLQGYLRDLLSHDPALMAKGWTGPVLIVSAGRDIQVPERDADILAEALPQAKRLKLAFASHVLKKVSGGRMIDNLRTYGDPRLPLHDGLIDGIVAFLKTEPKPR